MRLRDMDVRPGKVLRVEDNYGTVKASCCGIFAETEDPELLPPAIPFFKTSSTSFCSPHEDDKVLVWVNQNNPQQVYYTFMGNVEANDKSVLEQGNEDVEIVAMRPHDEEEPSILVYTEEEGWKMKDIKTGITASDEDGVEISHNDRKFKVRVDDEGILLADDKEQRKEPAVLGDALEDVLNDIVDAISTIQQSSASDPYLASLSASLAPKVAAIKIGISKIKSKNVCLN